MANRKRIRNKQEWLNFTASNNNVDEVRMAVTACFREIEILRKRPLIVYYVKFIRFYHNNFNLLNIDLSDVDPFSDLAHSIPASGNVDVLLHSPGGFPEAVERIVHILRKRFKEVHFLVPHSAYSAATMLALSGNSITMHPEASLGPFDPQINGVPAGSILKGFENVKKTVLKDEASLPVYQALLDKCSIETLEQSKNAINLSKTLVSTWLKDYMLNDGTDHSAEIKKAVNYFSNSELHLTHLRPLFYNTVNNLGLKIYESEGELSDLLREAYLMLDGISENTLLTKAYKNAYDYSYAMYAPSMNTEKSDAPKETPAKPAPPQNPPSHLKRTK